MSRVFATRFPLAQRQLEALDPPEMTLVARAIDIIARRPEPEIRDLERALASSERSKQNGGLR
jgi:hypothetical protein